MALTDAQIAESFTKWKAKRYKHGFPHHLESYLLTYLGACGWYRVLDGTERVKLKNRVLRIIRSSAGTRAAETAKKNREKAKREKQKSLQKSFDF